MIVVSDQRSALSPGVLKAQTIDGVLQLVSSHSRHWQERRCVINRFSISGALIYTKGAIVRQAGQEVFYILVSAKIATRDA